MFEKGNPGKKKGTKSRKTQAVEETAKRLGVDPFEIICLFAKGDWKTLGYPSQKEFPKSFQLDAAATACRYLYSQKRSIELSNSGDKLFQVSIVDYTKEKK